MFISFREEFSGGWNLWLGDEEVTSLTPELKQELPAMAFDEKAEMFFFACVVEQNPRLERSRYHPNTGWR
ncbi:hypothetical protein F444_05580 [Phytophthora nicotianae P1976]|uniref:Uncharacterized protein n=1 Tax=Phytophthora nicotianae P1976 TaxID=1317066 RepID=A0A081ALP0_PHYNI|nr:hypothetical protein F444_05580 [Phytophthora nicotianae P1976]